MTIEESIQVLCANVMVAVDRADMGEACSKMVEDALNVALASLYAWQEVRQKIGKLSLSWEYGQGVEDCLAIIDHYMQEVDDGK